MGRYRYRLYESLPAIPSGFGAIDKVTGGLRRCTLTTIASRPMDGKTSLALDLAINLLESGTSVLYYSLEMSAENLVERLSKKMDGPCVLEKDTSVKYGLKCLRYREAVMYIDDYPSYGTKLFLTKMCEFGVSHHDIVVIVDYLQLMQGPTEIRGCRSDEVEHIANVLKQVAVTFSVPVVAVSQMSRSIGNGVERRPGLDDIRESGEIERVSDNVLILTREKFYLDKSTSGETAKFSVTFDRVKETFTDVHITAE